MQNKICPLKKLIFFRPQTSTNLPQKKNKATNNHFLNNPDLRLRFHRLLDQRPVETTGDLFGSRAKKQKNTSQHVVWWFGRRARSYFCFCSWENTFFKNESTNNKCTGSLDEYQERNNDRIMNTFRKLLCVKHNYCTASTAKKKHQQLK